MKHRTDGNTFILEIDLDEPLPHPWLWRMLLKIRSNGLCEKCGCTPDRRLDAHHLSYEVETLRNGMALCSLCHNRLHFEGVKRPAEYLERQRIVQVGRVHKRGWKQTPETQARRQAAQQARRQREREERAA